MWYYYFIVLLLFDLFNVIQLSKVGPVSPTEMSTRYRQNSVQKDSGVILLNVN